MRTPLERVFLAASLPHMLLLTHAKASEDRLVEFAVCASGEEGVELVKEEEIGIVAMRPLAVTAGHC